MKTALGLKAVGTLLVAHAAGGGSGILTAVRGRLRRVFVLEQGWLVHATSNLLEEQLAEYLVHRQVLSPAARTHLVEEARRRNRKLYELALEQGAPPAADFRAAEEAIIADLLSSTLEWPEGEAEWQAGRVDLTGEPTVRLSPLGLIRAHASHFPKSPDAVRGRIGPPDTKPVVAAEIEHLLGGAELDRLGSYLLQACDGTKSVGALLAGSPDRDEPTLRAIYGLLLAGVLERAGVRPAEQGRDIPLTREECQLRLSLAAETDHYGVLGLDRKALGPAVREAYYRLARRYHPDRFRSGPLAEFLGLAESYFTRVTEAYNTLIRPESRQEYDRQLAEPQTAADTGKSDTQYLARQNFVRGKSLLERRHHAEAVRFLENAARLDGSVAEYHLELGLLLARNPRQREEAERHLLRTTELDPAATAAYLSLGQIYARAGRTPHAAAMFREALRWDPGNAQASAQLAELGPVGDLDPAQRGRPVFYGG
ncbi:MAG TPA: DnaJ domain-containing protein [Candidatus Polarisedimenticolaceae bacterium]|nr:DnaJ domain-containing protein [Candidatus Polarisedimenticolaceae bacterium]